MSSLSLVHAMHQTLVKALKDAGSSMTAPQILVLADIKKHPGSNQTEIVARTGIDRSTLADVIARITKTGLIERRRTKEDARAYAVKITEAGEAALKDGQRAAAKAEREFLRVYPFMRGADAAAAYSWKSAA